MVEERTVGIKTDDQIDVGNFRRITTCNGPEDTHIMRAVSSRNSKNGVAILSDDLLSDHVGIIRYRIGSALSRNIIRCPWQGLT